MPHSVNDGRRVGRALPRLTAARPLPARPTPSPPHSVPSEAPHGVFPWGSRTFPLSELDTRCTSRCSEGPLGPTAARGDEPQWTVAGLGGPAEAGGSPAVWRGQGQGEGPAWVRTVAPWWQERRRSMGPDGGAVWPCGTVQTSARCGRAGGGMKIDPAASSRFLTKVRSEPMSKEVLREEAEVRVHPSPHAVRGVLPPPPFPCETLGPRRSPWPPPAYGKPRRRLPARRV